MVILTLKGSWLDTASGLFAQAELVCLEALIRQLIRVGRVVEDELLLLASRLNLDIAKVQNGCQDPGALTGDILHHSKAQLGYAAVKEADLFDLGEMQVGKDQNIAPKDEDSDKEKEDGHKADKTEYSRDEERG